MEQARTRRRRYFEDNPNPSEPPTRKSFIPVLKGEKLRKISDNIKDYPPGTIFMTVDEWVRAKTPTQEKEDIAPLTPPSTIFESLIPVLNGERLRKKRGGKSAYPPGTVFMTRDEFVSLRQAHEQQNIAPLTPNSTGNDNQIPVFNGRRLRKKSDNLEDYRPGTVFMTVDEWVKSKTPTQEKENISPSSPNPTVIEQKTAQHRRTAHNYLPSSPTPPNLNIHQLLEEYEPNIKRISKEIATKGAQQFLHSGLPNEVKLSEEQLAILQQQLEIELYECLEGKFSWGFNRAIRSVADPQSLSLPSSFSHLDPEDF